MLFQIAVRNPRLSPHPVIDVGVVTANSAEDAAAKLGATRINGKYFIKQRDPSDSIARAHDWEVEICPAHTATKEGILEASRRY